MSSENAASHFIVQCSCGGVINLCGCAWVEQVLVVTVPRGCARCHDVAPLPTPAPKDGGARPQAPDCPVCGAAPLRLHAPGCVKADNA